MSHQNMNKTQSYSKRLFSNEIQQKKQHNLEQFVQALEEGMKINISQKNQEYNFDFEHEKPLDEGADQQDLKSQMTQSYTWEPLSNSSKMDVDNLFNSEKMSILNGSFDGHHINEHDLDELNFHTSLKEQLINMSKIFGKRKISDPQIKSFIQHPPHINTNQKLPQIRRGALFDNKLQQDRSPSENIPKRTENRSNLLNYNKETTTDKELYRQQNNNI